jgi:hypothetical protein
MTYRYYLQNKKNWRRNKSSINLYESLEGKKLLQKSYLSKIIYLKSNIWLVPDFWKVHN